MCSCKPVRISAKIKIRKWTLDIKISRKGRHYSHFPSLGLIACAGVTFFDVSRYRHIYHSLKKGDIMKKIAAWTALLCLVVSTLAFAGGDQNQNRHDGSKGKGKVNQHRINK